MHSLSRNIPSDDSEISCLSFKLSKQAIFIELANINPQKYCTAMQLLFRSDIVFIYAFAVAQGPRNDNKGYERRQGVCRKLASPATRGTRKLSLRRIHAIQPLRAQRDSF